MRRAWAVLHLLVLCQYGGLADTGASTSQVMAFSPFLSRIWCQVGGGRASSSSQPVRGRHQDGSPVRRHQIETSEFFDKPRSESEKKVVQKKTKVVVLRANREHSATVIWLHGQNGDTPEGWAATAQRMQSPWVKFLFPEAPNGGWGGKGTEKQMWAAASVVLDLVALEAEAGLPSERIVVGGFGTGGGAALFAALVSEARLGGVVSCASTLPSWVTSPHAAVQGRGGGFDCSIACAHLPALICHGNSDKVIPLNEGLSAYKRIASLGLQAKFRGYRDAGHALGPDMFTEIRQFISFCVPPTPAGLYKVQDMDMLSVAELLDWLNGAQIDTSECVTRSELVAIAVEVVKGTRFQGYSPGVAPRKRNGHSVRGAQSRQPVNGPFSAQAWGGEKTERMRSTRQASRRRGGWEEEGEGERVQEMSTGGGGSLGAFRAQNGYSESPWSGDSMLAEAEDALQRGRFDLADELVGGAKMAYRMDGRVDMDRIADEISARVARGRAEQAAKEEEELLGGVYVGGMFVAGKDWMGKEDSGGNFADAEEKGGRLSWKDGNEGEVAEQWLSNEALIGGREYVRESFGTGWPFVVGGVVATSEVLTAEERDLVRQGEDELKKWRRESVLGKVSKTLEDAWDSIFPGSVDWEMGWQLHTRGSSALPPPSTISSLPEGAGQNPQRRVDLLMGLAAEAASQGDKRMARQLLAEARILSDYEGLDGTEVREAAIRLERDAVDEPFRL